jgi:hypothetical protein
MADYAMLLRDQVTLTCRSALCSPAFPQAVRLRSAAGMK